MKKIISGVLCMIMLIAILSGCSVSEIDYIKVMNEINALDTVSEKGSLEISLGNVKETNILQRNIAETESAGEVSENNINIKYDYNIQMSDSQKILKIDSDLIIDDIQSPIDISVKDNKIVVSKDTIVGLRDILNKYCTESETKEFANFLVEYTADSENLIYTFPAEDVDELTHFFANNGDNLYNIITNFLKETLKGLDSGMFSGDLNNGLKFTLTIDSGKQLLVNAMNYVSDHREELISATQTMVTQLIEIMRPLIDKYGSELDVTSDELLILMPILMNSETLPTSEEIKAFATKIETDTNTAEYQEFVEAIKDSRFEMILKKNSEKSYTQTLMANIYYEGKTVAKVTGNSEICKLDDNIELTLNSTDKDTSINNDEVISEYTRYLNEKYPAYRATILYTDSDILTATLNISRYNKPENTIFSVDTKEVPLVNVDDRIYVPMRALAESLGYDVRWNDSTKKAYVIDKGVQVDMTGMIINDTTFIKVRDFEKLGLTVDWTPVSDSMFKATITK